MKKDAFYIENVQRGKSEYFTFLVKKYQNHIFNVVNKVIGNYIISEDITQETFFKAFKSINNFDMKRPFFPYLVQIASNCVKDYFKKEKQKNSVRMHFTGKAIQSNSIEQIDKIKVIYDLIYILPTDYREIFLLHYRDGKSIKEIAVLTGISSSNVKVRLFRGRKMLFGMWKNSNL